MLTERRPAREHEGALIPLSEPMPTVRTQVPADQPLDRDRIEEIGSASIPTAVF